MDGGDAMLSERRRFPHRLGQQFFSPSRSVDIIETGELKKSQDFADLKRRTNPGGGGGVIKTHWIYQYGVERACFDVYETILLRPYRRSLIGRHVLTFPEKMLL